MSKEMKYIEVSRTPHNTVRLFVHRNIMDQEHMDHFELFLNSMCIWSGADWNDDTHIAWEFELKFYDELVKFTKIHNEEFERGFCEWDE